MTDQEDVDHIEKNFGADPHFIKISKPDNWELLKANLKNGVIPNKE